MDYDAKKINEMIERFKSRKLKLEDITIYYDMDNCLALFSIHGLAEKALSEMENRGYFEGLPALDDGTKVIPVIQSMGAKVKILSACINTTYCKPEKRAWLAKHFPTISDKDIVLCEVGQVKAEIIKAKGEDVEKSILIDDYGQNLIEWIEAGGLAIKKTFSGKKRNIPTIKNHVEIFKILHDLNVL